MTELTTQGLNCPRCGGTVNIPEGQVVVTCPFCDMRGLVTGERGVRRYQLAHRTDMQTVSGKLKSFLSRDWAIAFNARSTAQVSELFLAYVPFWTLWGRVLGWVFGQEQVGSGKNKRWEARERKIAEDMVWTGPACDVSEFGVGYVPLKLQPHELQAFDSESLHANGLVFEPVTSQSEAQAAASNYFSERVQRQGKLDRIAQTFTRMINQRFGLVYYPLWVLRYLYRGRAYQMVVDGYSGEVIYGRAPGNTWYRAFILLAGMAVGAFLAVNGPILMLYFAANARGDDGEGLLVGALVALVIGAVMMFGGYTGFRYGEVYEFQKYGAEKKDLMGNMNNAMEQVTRWIK